MYVNASSFKNNQKHSFLVNYHFLWSTPNKSVQQPQQPNIDGRLKIQDVPSGKHTKSY